MSLYKENYSKYIAEYTKANYDRIELRAPKGYKEILKTVANGSMNQFILDAVNEKIKEAKNGK